MADTRLDKRMVLSSSLPSEDRENGLDWLTELVLTNPKGTQLIGVVVLEAKKIEDDLLLDTRRPLMRIREIEAVSLDDAPADLLELVKQWRTNRRGAEAEQDSLLDAPVDDYLDDAPAVVVAMFDEDTDR